MVPLTLETASLGSCSEAAPSLELLSGTTWGLLGPGTLSPSLWKLWPLHRGVKAYGAWEKADRLARFCSGIMAVELELVWGAAVPCQLSFRFWEPLKVCKQERKNPGVVVGLVGCAREDLSNPQGV